MYKKIIFYLFTIVIIAFLVNSCQEDSITPSVDNIQLTDEAGNGCDTIANKFCGSPGIAFFQNPCPGTVSTIDLWAGVGNPQAGTLVGHVEFYFVSGTTWKVKYVFNNNFKGHEIHFAISCTYAGIPKNRSGNPVPGQFPYHFSNNSDTGFGHSKEFNITLPTGCSCFYVAAHATGNINAASGIDCFNNSIPAGCVTLSNLHHAGSQGCYWIFNLGNAGIFNGSYCGWCMDLGTAILDTHFTCAHMFSSLAPFPDYLKSSIEGWQDMDKINYLINTWHVGQSIQRKNYLCQNVSTPGVINAFDYQKAIWSILDLGPGNDYSELSDSLVVNALVCDIRAHGEGFVPNCQNGDLIVFFIDPGLNPNGSRAQPILSYAPCCSTGGGGNETAWGDGKYGGNFLGHNWATFFKWCPTCP